MIHVDEILPILTGFRIHDAYLAGEILWNIRAEVAVVAEVEQLDRKWVVKPALADGHFPCLSAHPEFLLTPERVGKQPAALGFLAIRDDLHVSGG